MRDWPLLPIPRKIDVTNWIVYTTYLYAAKVFSLNSHETLVVDFYDIQIKETILRIFVSDGEFATLKLISPSKWSDSMIDKLLPLRFSLAHLGMPPSRGCAPANKRTGVTIKSFLKRRIKGEMQSDALDCLFLYQLGIRQRALGDRHQKIRDQIDATFSVIEELPEDINEWIEKYPLYEHQYIFYRRVKKNKIEGLCSSCKNHVLLTTAKHNFEGVCPVCSHKITFKAEGISQRTLDKFVFNYIQKSIGDGIIQRVFEGYKSYLDGYSTPRMLFTERRRYVYSNDSVSPYHFGNFRNTGEMRWCDGAQHSIGYMSYSNISYLYPTNLRSVIRDTKWMDSGIDRYAIANIQFDPYDYFWLFKEQNGIRYLVDNKLYSLVEDGIARSTTGKMDEGFFQTLRKNKAYFNDFREIGISVKEVVMISSFGSRPPKRDIMLRIRSMGIVSEIPHILKYTTVDKSINYIYKAAGAESSARDMIIMWLDYLKMAEDAGYDSRSTFVLFPRDLRKEHDRLVAERKALENAVYDKAIREMFFEASRMLAYDDGNMFIRPPMNAAEICEEAVTLRHCVDKYIGEVAMSQTMILFVRHKDEPLKPFYTVEYRNNEVRQCRGLRNVFPTYDVNCFLKNWSEFVTKK